MKEQEQYGPRGKRQYTGALYRFPGLNTTLHAPHVIREFGDENTRAMVRNLRKRDHKKSGYEDDDDHDNEYFDPDLQ